MNAALSTNYATKATSRTAQSPNPEGLYSLPVGTKYTVIDQVAVPISAQSGEVTGNFFYPAGSAEGSLIRTREANTWERGTEVRRDALNRPTAPMLNLNPMLVLSDILSDWK